MCSSDLPTRRSSDLEEDVVAVEGAGEEGSTMKIMMMSMEMQRSHSLRDIVAGEEEGAGVDPLDLAGVMVEMVLQWKKLVDMMMGSLMHLLCKGMKVAEEGAVVEAEAVDVVVVEAVAVDLLLLLKSRDWLARQLSNAVTRLH